MKKIAILSNNLARDGTDNFMISFGTNLDQEKYAEVLDQVLVLENEQMSIN